MLPRTVARRVLRDLPSSPCAVRPLFRPVTSIRQLSVQRPPPPPPPPAPTQQDVDALSALQKLSHLTPAQITELLSTSPRGAAAPPYPPPRSRRSILTRRALWALFFFALGYKFTSDQLYQLRFTAPFLEDTTEIHDPADIPMYRQAAMMQAVNEHPMLNSLMSSTTSENGVTVPAWDNWQPYHNFTDEQRARHLCGGALDHPDRLGLVHHVFRHRLTGEVILAVVFGSATTGWPGVVHGGMLSTTMDEAMGRLAALNFPANTAVTAKLEMNFREPATPGVLYVVRVNKVLPEKQGAPGEEDKTDRKLWIVGRLEGPEGEVVCEAKGLFVVPKGGEVKPLGKMF